MMEVDFTEDALEALLPIYYRRLFPFNTYYQWLSYGNVNKTYFPHRELSFTLKGDIYVRYQSFSNLEELENEIKKQCPIKIDIGAVYSFRPKDRRMVTIFQPQEKELVFDIDMTDYDEVRYCCSGADICRKCWQLMVIAVKILDRALREDFGFVHLLWVYSGRRGIHCWVCDQVARKLPVDARSAIAEYLTIIKGGENTSKKVHLYDRIHPSIQSALKVIRHYFEAHALIGQNILGDSDRWSKVLNLIPDDHLRQQVASVMSLNDSSVERWKALVAITETAINKGEGRKCQFLVEEIMLQFCYPRLDVNVTKGVNHLLKSPFCIHPKTGCVCIPVDPKRMDSFDPHKVPNISQLIEELNLFDAEKSADIEQPAGPKLHGRFYKATYKIALNDFKPLPVIDPVGPKSLRITKRQV